MNKRIVEIAEDNRHLSVDRGFLVVSEKGEELGRVPIDAICAVIANAHGITYSNNLLARLAEYGTPLVICGANHNPLGFLWSVDGNCYQAARMDAQIKATKPLAKRLWQQIVQTKIIQQAALLKILNKPTAPLTFLIKKVQSGDTSNVEATAARRYLPLIFGEEFVRDREAGGINALLNYGYIVLRAATARAIIAAGLHPTIGIFHKNSNNAMRLVDDLMEPFRPAVDYVVCKLIEKKSLEITTETKKALVGALNIVMQTDNGKSEVSICLQNLASSLGQVYQGASSKLNLPITMLG
jgi:CRISP-associated protein Cas1